MLHSYDLERALVLAIKAHEGQTRSDGTPYIAHPVAVMELVKKHGGSLYQEIVAVLHDTIEDSKDPAETAAEIQKKFPPEVYQGVMELTNLAEGDFATRQANLVRLCQTMSDENKLIKLADRYHNILCAQETWSKSRVQRYAKAGLEIMEAMSPLPDDCLILGEELRVLIDRNLQEEISSL